MQLLDAIKYNLCTTVIKLVISIHIILYFKLRLLVVICDSNIKCFINLFLICFSFINRPAAEEQGRRIQLLCFILFHPLVYHRYPPLPPLQQHLRSVLTVTTRMSMVSDHPLHTLSHRGNSHILPANIITNL